MDGISFFVSTWPLTCTPSRGRWRREHSAIATRTMGQPARISPVASKRDSCARDDGRVYTIEPMKANLLTTFGFTLFGNSSILDVKVLIRKIEIRDFPQPKGFNNQNCPKGRREELFSPVRLVFSFYMEDVQILGPSYHNEWPF